MNPNIWTSQTPIRSRQLYKKPAASKANAVIKQNAMGSPAIGILTTNEKIGYLSVYLLAAHRLRSEAFVFKPEDVDWDRETVRGWRLVLEGVRQVWTRAEYPLPNVVYNRITNRSAEAHPSVVELKRRMARRGIPVFNKNFFNKTEVYRLLAGSGVSDLLPSTKPFGTAQELFEMCQNHQLVYIKPSGGSLGMGIIRIEREKSGYRVQYRRRNSTDEWNYIRFQDLFKHVKKLCERKNYIVQQGIQLKEINGAPTDFRIHLHKTHHGSWECTAIGGKVAGNGSITTHVHSGGFIMDPDEIFVQWQGRNDFYREKLATSAIQIAEELEKRSGEIIGELGMDMGVDIKDRIWLFEVNSKPGRAIFKHPHLREMGLQSAARIIEYSLFLAKVPVRRA